MLSRAQSMMCGLRFGAQRRLLRAGFIVLLAGQLAACGTVSAGGASQVAQVVTAFNVTADATVAGLQIHSDGVQCGAFLVLKSPGATYSSKDIEDISRYAQSNVGQNSVRNLTITSEQYGVRFYTERGGQRYFAIPQVPDTTGMPSTLEWVPGGESCFGQLEITNVTASDLVISSVGATLNRDAAMNSVNYHLLDVCTLPGYDCEPPGGAAPNCSYFASITLVGGPRGAHVNAPLAIHPGHGEVDTCVTPLTLSPSQSQEVGLVFTSKPQHLLYSVALTLDVNGKVYTAPSTLSQSLAFVDDTTAFSCYAYQGGKFVVQQPKQLDYDVSYTRYCV